MILFKSILIIIIIAIRVPYKKIKLSEEKFSKVFYLNPSEGGLSDLVSGKFLELNDAFYSLLGFDKNEELEKRSQNWEL